MIELVGEWNDCIGNDIMFLKRDVVDHLIKKRINKFVLLCDNVLNYHGDDDCYYEEWYDDVKDDGGWICVINSYDHVLKEMEKYRLYYYMSMGQQYNEMTWRAQKPDFIVQAIEELMHQKQKSIL